MQQVGWRKISKGLVKGFQRAMRGFSNTALVASALKFYCPESRLFFTSPYLQVKQSNRGHVLVYSQVPRPKDVTRGTRSLKEFSSELIKGETRLLQVFSRGHRSVGQDFWG